MRRYSNHLCIYEKSTCQPKILSTTIFSKSCSILPFNMCFYFQSFSPCFQLLSFFFLVYALFSLMLKSDCHFRNLNLKMSNVKLEVWEVNINPLTRSCFFFVFYTYSKLTSKCIINPSSACLLLKQCWTKLAAIAHLVRCTRAPNGISESPYSRVKMSSNQLRILFFRSHDQHRE